METVSRKIGNSIGTIFPKDISPEEGIKFDIYKVGEAYILKPKKTNIFSNDDWTDFRDSLTQEDMDWDLMNPEGREEL